MYNLNSIILCFLILSVGSFYNNLKYKIKENIPKKISLATNSYLKGYGYWLNGRNMKDVNLSDLSKKGTTDIFLNFYSITLYGQKEVASWISKANQLNIRVHIWMQAFYRNGEWINPATTKLTNTILQEAKTYAAIKGVAGIHFDYLRYPGNAYKTSGGTEAINKFVQLAVAAIKNINSNCIISAALMPEKTSNKYYYGQDYDAISKYLDVVVPMIYKGNYKSGTSWIKSTSEWYVTNSKGAAVWSGLQSYVSDDNAVALSESELTADIKAALEGKANGVILFRYGLSKLLNFNSFKQ